MYINENALWEKLGVSCFYQVEARSNFECDFLRNVGNSRDNSEIHKNSFFPRTSKDWNNLSDNIVNIDNLDTFKKSVTSGYFKAIRWITMVTSN